MGGREGSPTLLRAKTCEYGTTGWGQEHLHISAGGCLFLGALMGREGGKRAILAVRHLITSRVPPTSMSEIMHCSFLLVTEKCWDFACVLPIITVRCYFCDTLSWNYLFSYKISTISSKQRQTSALMMLWHHATWLLLQNRQIRRSNGGEGQGCGASAVVLRSTSIWNKRARKNFIAYPSSPNFTVSLEKYPAVWAEDLTRGIC